MKSDVSSSLNYQSTVKTRASKKWFAHFFEPILYLLPALMIYITVIVYPTFYTAFLSLFQWNGVSPEKEFVGLGNYTKLFFEDSVFKTAIKNNVILTVLSLIFLVGVSLLFAVVLNTKLKGRIVFRGVFYFPYMLSNIVIALIWSWMYHPTLGIINEVLGFFGVRTIGWLSEPNLAIYSIFLAYLWQGVGGLMIIFLAGLQTISDDMYEAGKIDGANIIQQFFYITIPLLRETFVIVFALTLVHAMKIFDLIYAMTGGGPAQSTQVLASWMYYNSFIFANVGLGSAIATVLVVFVMIVSIPYILYTNKQSHV